MRLRNIPGAEEYLIADKQYFVAEPVSHKGNWKAVFGNDQPIHAEFGTGKGKFITTLAELNPDINYIGVEYQAVVLFKALKRVEKRKLPNLRFILFDVNETETAFAEGDLQRIFLNFVDPWPKSRHAKRRLTHRRFIAMFRKVLGLSGEIHVKTDNRPLFEFTLNEFAEINLKMKNISLDLAQDTTFENVTTEYEEKFMRKGHPIFRLEAGFRE